MIEYIERNSEMYNTLAWMGLLSTEDRRIRYSRENDTTAYEDLDLTYDDIERVGYYNPNVKMKLQYKGKTELWFEDTYLNPAKLQWIETDNGLYAVMDKRYDEMIPVKCHYNPNIIYRYSNVVDDDSEYVHVYTIDTREIQYSTLYRPEHAAYYISENKICVPTAIWIDEYTIQYRAPYKHDIDFMLCTNLAFIGYAKANESMYIDTIYADRCFHRILVDNSPNYPIDTRFYPCIRINKDCTIRVYTDLSSVIMYPEVSRLLAYPEYYHVDDPYTDPLLKDIPMIDDIIISSDSEEEIIQKFSKIAQYCYRMWEKYPFNASEVSEFVICDNRDFERPVFQVKDIYLYDEKVQKICTTVPVEPFRDIVLYNGVIFSDYIAKRIRVTSDGSYVESDEGNMVYLIDTSYQPDNFTIIKFNTAEDTQWVNIGEYIDLDYVAHLHYKMNRFYRNMVTLRLQFLDNEQPEEDYVRIATEQPNTKDSYLWFELLTNVIPEMFETKPIDAITLSGLDPNHIPDDIREGAYRLELDPEGGPASYNELMLTYYKLSKAHKEYLALQVGEGVDDPRIQTFKNIKVGNLKDAVLTMNEMFIENESMEPTTTETTYEAGRPDNPGTVGKDAGDLYVQIHNPPDVPEDEQNIDILEISMGPNTPEGKETTLWIDNPPEDNIYEKDELDHVTDHITVANNPHNILDADVGDYAIDSMDDTFNPDQEGELTIDDLLDGLDETSEIDASPPVEDLMGGISEAIASNKTIDEIENPEVGQMALDDITFFNEETGKTITMEEINAMSQQEKLDVVNRLITDDDVPEDAEVGDMWISYLSSLDPTILNTIVYKILLTEHVYHINQPAEGDLALEGDTLPEKSESLAYGNFPKWVKPDQMLIQPLTYDDEGNVRPDFDMIREYNVRYIMSITEPDNVEKDDLWLKIPAATLKEVIKEVISRVLMEIGLKMPEGFYYDDGNTVYATMGLDYHAHDKGTEGVGELFRERIDESLHPIYYGHTIDESKLKEDDIWYEFVDDIANKVVYSDQYSMVIRVDERLAWLKFSREDIQAFVFDDILINFRGVLGVKYMSIIADLINSGEIDLKDVIIFYRRLITIDDELDPRLKRLYTGTSHVVSTAKIDTSDYAVLYSSNIGRFTMDYSSPDTTNREREAAYRMCIDLRNRDFAFLDRRMAIFLNGKYIPYGYYKEEVPGLIEINGFKEIIATVDILYSKTDQCLIDLKKAAYPYCPEIDDTKYIQRPEKNYTKMEPIKVYDYTSRGYYDILLNEYIFNGKLERILRYLEEHPEEADEFRRDLVQKFHAISDIDLSGESDHTARIVLSGNAYHDHVYQIGIPE